MRVHNGYLGPCGQIRRSPSRTAVKNGLHADGDDPKPLLGPLSEPPRTPIQKLMVEMTVVISNELPIGADWCPRLCYINIGLVTPLCPNPGTHRKGGAQEFVQVRGVWSVEASRSDHHRKRRR